MEKTISFIETFNAFMEMPSVFSLVIVFMVASLFSIFTGYLNKTEKDAKNNNFDTKSLDDINKIVEGAIKQAVSENENTNILLKNNIQLTEEERNDLLH